jgi:amino acid efflux transporter
VIAATGLLLIGLYALHLVSTTELVALPTTMFLCVYLTCTASAARILTGPARAAAVPAALAVTAVLVFSGWALLVTAVIAIVAALATRPAAAGPAWSPVPGPAPGSPETLGPAICRRNDMNAAPLSL